MNIGNYKQRYSGILLPEVSEPEYLFKIILIGDSGVGKTNFLSQFVSNQFTPDSKTTLGIEFSTKIVQVGGKIIKVQLWDTAGHERYKTLTSNYYKGAHGAILMYDVTNSLSFNSLTKWIKDLNDFSDNDKLVTMLVGNKIDMNMRSITTREAVDFAENEQFLFIETSALYNTNVQEAFTLLISTILQATLKHKKTHNHMNSKQNSIDTIQTESNTQYCCK